MQLTKQDPGYRLQLYGYEVHNLNLTLNKCGMKYYNYLIEKRTLDTASNIPETFIDTHTEWSSEFKKRMSKDFYIDDEDIFHIIIALEYSIVVDKYHAQFICEFGDSLCGKLRECGKYM